MSDYRRSGIAGGTYFFTVALQNRRSRLLVEQVDALRHAVRKARTTRSFHIDAWVVLPEHMHCVWTLPAGDSDYSTRWRDIKRRFAKAINGKRSRPRCRLTPTHLAYHSGGKVGK